MELEKQKWFSFDKKGQSKECLHEKCKECNGTGRKENGKTCIHIISCPCKKCTPTYL